MQKAEPQKICAISNGVHASVVALPGHLQKQYLALNPSPQPSYENINLDDVVEELSFSSGVKGELSRSLEESVIIKDPDEQQKLKIIVENILKKIKTNNEMDTRVLLEAYGFALGLSYSVGDLDTIKNIEKEIIATIEQFAFKCLHLQIGVALSNLKNNLMGFKTGFENIRLHFAKGEHSDLRKSLADIDERFKKIIKQMFDNVHSILGKPSVGGRYAIVSVGSLATQMTTPYSDVEYIILVDDDSGENRVDFVDRFADLFDMLMLGFGESPVYIAEPFLDEFKEYFKYHRKGTRVDEHKRPQDKNRLFGLFNTPAGLLKKLALPKNIIHEPGNHTTAALLTTRFLAGDEGLYKDFVDLFQNVLHTKEYLNCLKEILDQDIISCNQFLDRLENDWFKKELDKEIEVKDILIHAIHLARMLAIFLRSCGEDIELKPNFFDIIEVLQNSDYIDQKQCQNWYKLVNNVFKLRLELQTKSQSTQAKITLNELKQKFDIPALIHQLQEIAKIVCEHLNKRKNIQRPTRISDVIKSTDSKIASNKTHSLDPWQKPFLTEEFEGQESQILMLKRKLKLVAAKEPINKTVISGTGGIGKTSLAVHLTTSPPYNYTLRAWFKASTKEDLTQEYKDFADGLGMNMIDNTPSQIKSKIKSWFQQNSEWLIVYDDAKSQAEIKDFIPSEGGQVIITTRSTKGGKDIIEVPPMSPENSIRVLKKYIDLEQYGEQKTRERDACKELAIALGGLPLALSQAGSYMRATKRMPSEYIELYASNKKDMMEQDGRDDHEPVYFTWDITIAHIKEKMPRAVELLNIMVCYNASDISRPLLSKFDSKIKLDNYLALLNEYSIINLSNQKVSLHKVLIDVALEKQKQRGEHPSYLSKALQLFELSFNYNRDNSEELKFCQTMLSQGLGLLELTKYEKIENNSTVKLHYLMGIFFLDYMHNIDAAFVHLKHAYNIVIDNTSKELSIDDNLKKKIYRQLGKAYSRLQKWDEAEELLLKGEMGSVECLCDLASFYMFRKGFTEHPTLSIEEIDTNISGIDENEDDSHSSDNADVASVNTVLVIDKKNMAKIPSKYETEKHQQKAKKYLDVARETLGLTVMEKAMIAHLYGNYYSKIKRLEDAEREYVTALTLKREHYAQAHPEIARTLLELGRVALRIYHQSKRSNYLTQAIAYLEESLKMKIKFYDTYNHIDIIKLLVELSSIYFKETSHHENAEKIHDYLSKALETKKNIINASSKTWANIGQLFFNLNDRSNALLAVEGCRDKKSKEVIALCETQPTIENNLIYPEFLEQGRKRQRFNSSNQKNSSETHNAEKKLPSHSTKLTRKDHKLNTTPQFQAQMKRRKTFNEELHGVSPVSSQVNSVVPKQTYTHDSDANHAAALFLKDPSHLKFNIWYDPVICHYLLQMTENKAQCIRVMLYDEGGNTKTFNEQVQTLVALSNLMNKHVLFICKEPGSTNHYICGLLKETKLLLINPLELSKHASIYETLAILRKDNILSKVYLSGHKLQRVDYETTGLFSCGPIVTELAMHILSEIREEVLNAFWDELAGNSHQDNHAASGLDYYNVKITGLLPTVLSKLSDFDNQETYQSHMCDLREKHLKQLKELPLALAKMKGLSVTECLTKCKDESPAQVVFNSLLTQNKTLLNIHELEECKLLEKELKSKFVYEHETQIAPVNTSSTSITFSNVKEPRAVGFYESQDILILRDALLTKEGLKVNKHNLVERLDGSQTIHSIYLLPPSEGVNVLVSLKETICIALLDKNPIKNILFPYRMQNQSHWIVGHVSIENKIISLRIHDSTKLYEKEEFEHDLESFLKELTSVQEFLCEPTRLQVCQENSEAIKKILFGDNGGAFTNYGRSSIYHIQIDEHGQIKNNYCGGYVVHLMVGLTINPNAIIADADSSIWQCNNDNDLILRREDANTVAKYNQSKVNIFDRSGDGAEYQKNKIHKEKSGRQKEESRKILDKIDVTLKNIPTNIINEIYQEASAIELREPGEIKSCLLSVYNSKKASLSQANPLSYFFSNPNDEITEASTLNSNVIIKDLWEGFMNALKDSLKNDTGLRFAKPRLHS